MIEASTKKRKPPPKYSENEALRRAQKKYFENNKEKRLQHSREANKKWRETEDREIVLAKQRERAKRHYEKKKLLKKRAKEMEDLDSKIEEFDRNLYNMLKLKLEEPLLQAQDTDQ